MEAPVEASTKESGDENDKRGIAVSGRDNAQLKVEKRGAWVTETISRYLRISEFTVSYF